MSAELRQRHQSAPAISPPKIVESTPGDGTSGKDYKLVSAGALDDLNAQANKKRRRPWRRYVSTFSLGGIFALVLAAFFSTPQGSLDKLVAYAGLDHMSLDSIMDVLPAGILRDVSDLQSREKATVDYDSFQVGLRARKEGIKAKYPVIMIPGVISTGLESWGTEEQSRQYFRKRLWGSWSMMRALVMDKTSWKRHVMLDQKTGLDPPGIKLRAAQGFDAADFFITGYWIWNKILENLATIGYDPTNAFTAAYDWRLTYLNLEVRDQYFTRLKSHIEVAKQVSGLKVVLLSHSMGSQVLFYFFHWVEAEGYGNGGPSWVEDHVDSWINISGCMLGALKDLPAVLSGEMRDTVQLNAFAVYGLEKFLSRHERADIFRAMPGISSMLPIGGNAIWGDENGAPDDHEGQAVTFGKFISFKPMPNITNHANLTVRDSIPFLHEHTEDWYSAQVKRAYSQGVARSAKKVEENQKKPRKWINPLETRLPLAPNLKIYCFYGVGKPTERAYFYREDPDPNSPGNNRTSMVIDSSVTMGTDGFIDHGVVMGEGDGTVNLLSTGYMCNKGWKIPRYNPANISVVAFEMPHEPERFNPRGGPNTADHVDILGRRSLNDLILRVAGGHGDKIQERVVSRIKEYAEKVRIPVEDEEDLPEEDDQYEEEGSVYGAGGVLDRLTAGIKSTAGGVQAAVQDFTHGTSEVLEEEVTGEPTEEGVHSLGDDDSETAKSQAASDSGEDVAHGEDKSKVEQLADEAYVQVKEALDAL